MKKQKGFTLIELIIVIIVLGILAVAAAPKFLGFAGDARAAAIDGMRGGMSGASSLVYAKAAINGLTHRGASDSGYPKLPDGIEIVYGYPAASQEGIASAMDFNAADWDFAFDAAGETAKMRVSPRGMNDAVDASNADSITACYVEYTNAAQGSAPAIKSNSTDC